MKVALLCGGIGKRMFPIAEDKFLLKFLGRTLLEHQIEQARRKGLDQFVIIGNPGNIEKIRRVTQGLSGVTIALQEEPRGMANALESAEDVLSEEPIIVVNPNDLFDGSAYDRILEVYKSGSASSYILAHKVSDYFPGGYLVVNEEDELQHIVEKPKRGEEPSNLVNIVVHLHTQPRQLFRRIKEVGSADDGSAEASVESAETLAEDAYERALDRMAKEGERVKAVAYDGFWAAIKYPWDIFAAMEHFLGGKAISPSAEVSAKATIEGDVILEDNVKVLENAVIKVVCGVIDQH